MRFVLSRGVVLDETAALALGAGNVTASRLVVAAERSPLLHVYVPALCLAVAETARPGVAEHLGSLESIEIAELDFAAAAAVGKRVRGTADGEWGAAHALYVAMPSVDWPKGCSVLTRNPERYTGTGIRTIQLA
ncbi:hypothetical protein [Streptomyces sp. NPDC059928]|uniref:hypothetical protein n=1 Tax=unclassified Streptomyces TaxID=2593676 RepID=UPI003654E0DF